MEYLFIFIIKAIIFVWVIRFGLEWLKQYGYLHPRQHQAVGYPQTERQVDVRTYDVYPRNSGYLPHPRDREDELREFQEFKRFKEMRRR